jgi:hypothetical protein
MLAGGGGRFTELVIPILDPLIPTEDETHLKN